MGASPSHIGLEDNAIPSSSSEPWTPPVCKYPEDNTVGEKKKQNFSEKLSREHKMKTFHKELQEKRKQRQSVIATKANEMNELRRSVKELTTKVEVLENENQRLQINIIHDDVKTNLNDANKPGEFAMPHEETALMLKNVQEELQLVTEERNALKNHIEEYKKVSQCTKDMLQIRDEQLNQLKAKLSEIESSVASFEHETSAKNLEHDALTNLKKEYQTQLENIKELKALYEKRSRAFAFKQIKFDSKLNEYKILLEKQTQKSIDLYKEVEELSDKVSEKSCLVSELESQLGLSKAETKHFQQELSVINQLFSQALVGANKKNDLDIDQLVTLLEQNRGLLSDMAVSESEETSAMPRVLLDLVNQMQQNTDVSEECANGEAVNENLGDVNNKDKNLDPSIKDRSPSATDEINQDNRGDERHEIHPSEVIVSKLPKVWRVLMELLSHQNICPKTQDVPEVEQGDGSVPKNRGSACYKSIQTPTGPRLVLSVSKTYIRLKDLILEKKALQKELARLKQLNNHLEARFGSQQRRLGNVSSELSHTWCLAGRMQKSYKTLHSHEQILRYELQQKRKMLNGLKQELQLCREKWQQAKEKNTESEVEWKRLRSEFANRKLLDQADGCGSAESGYSDERSDDSDNDLITDMNVKKPNKVDQVEFENNSTEKDLVNTTSLSAAPRITEVEDLSITLANKVYPSEGTLETGRPSCEVNETETSSCSSNMESNSTLDCEISCKSMPKQDLENSIYVASNDAKSDKNINEIEKKSNFEYSLNEYSNSEPSCSSSLEKKDNPPELDISKKISKESVEKPAKLSRDERLRLMEEQCKQLVNKVTKTSDRSKQLCFRLEELHEQYGRDGHAEQDAESGKSVADKTEKPEEPK